LPPQTQAIIMNRDYTANCAICNGPGDPECPCEGDRLKIAIDQAEKKWIESWVAKTRCVILKLSIHVPCPTALKPPY
jgi:hypothetical protein